jgi:hypothetical protein
MRLDCVLSCWTATPQGVLSGSHSFEMRDLYAQLASATARLDVIDVKLFRNISERPYVRNPMCLAIFPVQLENTVTAR